VATTTANTPAKTAAKTVSITDHASTPPTSVLVTNCSSEPAPADDNATPRIVECANTNRTPWWHQ